MIFTVVCDLRVDAGNCVSFTTRYHYDNQQQQCVPFQYGGCGGNANNFQSDRSCTLKCGEGKGSSEIIFKLHVFCQENLKKIKQILE